MSALSKMLSLMEIYLKVNSVAMAIAVSLYYEFWVIRNETQNYSPTLHEKLPSLHKYNEVASQAV